MRYFLAVGVAVLLSAALYFGPMAKDALAFSPDIKVVETEVTIIEEDEGYYDDLIVTKAVGAAHSASVTPHHHAGISHDVAWSSDSDMVGLMHDLRQSPAQYLDELRAEGFNIADGDDSVAFAPTSVLELPWVADGTEGNEKETVDLLTALYELNPDAADRVAGMPFLRTFGPADLEAVWSLTYLAEYDVEESATSLNDVLDNPHLADHGGIDDTEARLVAVLGGTNYFNRDMVSTLLDPYAIPVANYVLPGSGNDIHMTIIRLEPGSISTDNLFSYAIQEAESIMDKPLRTDYVAVLVADDILPSFAAGAHFGTHILIPPMLDTDDRSEFPGNWAGIVIAHEVAHYYWFSGHHLWVDEGAADFIAGLVELRRTGQVLEPDNVPCSFYRSLLHLELAQPDLGSYGGLCHYSLGERLWLDLYSHLGEEGTFSVFRAFHASVSADEEVETPSRQHLTGAALPEDVTGSDRTLREILLSRHYGQVLNSDPRPVNPEIPALNGRVTDVILARVHNGRVVETYTDFFSIPASRIVNRHQLVLIIELDVPLPADTKLRFGTLEYYEDGFVFDRQEIDVEFEAGSVVGIAPLSGIGFTPNYQWPTGLYWVYAYHAKQKIAELYFDVAP